MFSDFSATLLLAERPHLKTESLLCFIMPERVLSTAFWELQLRPGIPEHWAALWFNSTYGIISYLSVSTSSQGDIFKLKKEQLKNLVFPKFVAEYEPALDAVMLRLNEAIFHPYSKEFALAVEDKGSRILIDRMFSNLIGLPPIGTADYRALAIDPVVCKRPLT